VKFSWKPHKICSIFPEAFWNRDTSSHRSHHTKSCATEKIAAKREELKYLPSLSNSLSPLFVFCGAIVLEYAALDPRGIEAKGDGISGDFSRGFGHPLPCTKMAERDLVTEVQQLKKTLQEEEEYRAQLEEWEARYFPICLQDKLVFKSL
jgi:hypothetical protein